MRYILVLSVLACLAASPAFAHGSGGAAIGSGGSNTGAADHGENDARGGIGNGPVGQIDGMRWDDELGCVEGTMTRCNK